MARSRDRGRIHIGVGGHVVAIDTSTGEEVWRTKLKGSMYTTVCRLDDQLLAGSNGELFCLDPASGEVVWHNKLKGLGMGIIAFPGNDPVAMMAASAAAAAAAAS